MNIVSPPYSSATRPNSLLAHLGGVCPLLVDLVDRDHDRHSGRLGVVECLDGLRHDAVVRRDHEDRDVSDLRTSGAHGGERLVARGVDEGDGAFDALVLRHDLVGTNVLGDSTRLTGNDVGIADRVEQSRLSVVDVTHDGDDGRAGLEVILCLVIQLLVEVDVEAAEQLAILVLRRDHLDLEAELLAEDVEGRLVKGLGRGGHLSQVEQYGH
jgi:hypothetical protein